MKDRQDPIFSCGECGHNFEDTEGGYCNLLNGWGNYHGGAAEIRYIPGRVKFSKSVPKPMTRYDFEEKRKKYQYSAPFPSIIVIFRPGNPEYLKTTPFIVSKAKRKVINNVHSNSEQTLHGTGTLKIHETIP